MIPSPAAEPQELMAAVFSDDFFDKLWNEVLDIQKEERPNNRDILGTLRADDLEFWQYMFREGIMLAFRRAYAPVEQVGVVTVPVIPTEAMLNAVMEWIREDQAKDMADPMRNACGCMGPVPFCRCQRRRFVAQYKAMLAASGEK